MRLTDYLSREKMTITEFGQRIGRTTATISRINRGRNRPDWSTMESIVDATAGAVMPNDFLAVRDERGAGSQESRLPKKMAALAFTQTSAAIHFND